ncbi:MAG: ATP-binding protein [Desulfuromonas sp.]|nr:ATP-binding protein [Desulfuromonas sp.]
MSSVDINSVVQTAIRLLDNQIKKSTYNFHCQLGTNLPQIHASAQRVEQVVVNLLLNACQALQQPQQAIWVTTAYSAESAELSIRVQDEGCGIAADKLDFLMDPFFTTKREQGGTGLGLSVSAGIAKSHGGRLEFSSTLGSGMVATLYLPQRRTDNG